MRIRTAPAPGYQREKTTASRLLLVLCFTAAAFLGAGCENIGPGEQGAEGAGPRRDPALARKP